MQRQLHPRYSLALIAITASLLAPLAATARPTTPTEPAEKPPAERLVELKAQINLLNLVNGLHLDQAQMAAVVAKANEAEAIRQAARANLDVAVRALERLKASLEAGGENDIPAREIERAAKRWNQTMKDRQAACVRQINTLGEQLATSTLTEAQIEVLRDYTACLVPSQDLRNPVRVGQAAHSAKAIKHLENLRNLPERRFQMKKEAIVDSILERTAKQLGALPADKLNKERSRLLMLLDRVRSLDDVTFNIEADQLAQDFTPYQKQIVNEVKDIRRTIHPERSKIVRFLLDPNIVPILEKRAAYLASQPAGSKTDLTKVKPAPNCLDGECGVDE